MDRVVPQCKKHEQRLNSVNNFEIKNNQNVFFKLFKNVFNLKLPSEQAVSFILTHNLNIFLFLQSGRNV